MVILTNPEVEKFIKSLQTATGTRVVRTIVLLETFGHNIGMPHSKKIAADIFELRI